MRKVFTKRPIDKLFSHIKSGHNCGRRTLVKKYLHIHIMASGGMDCSPKNHPEGRLVPGLRVSLKKKDFVHPCRRFFGEHAL